MYQLLSFLFERVYQFITYSNQLNQRLITHFYGPNAAVSVRRLSRVRLSDSIWIFTYLFTTQERHSYTFLFKDSDRQGSNLNIVLEDCYKNLKVKDAQKNIVLYASLQFDGGVLDITGNLKSFRYYLKKEDPPVAAATAVIDVTWSDFLVYLEKECNVFVPISSSSSLYIINFDLEEIRLPLITALELPSLDIQLLELLQRAK